MANERARNLRTNMTDAERKLWSRIRRSALGHRFRRQHPLGPYVVDFVCLDRRLVIEVDGGQHNSPDGIEKDQRRTAWLNDAGYRVLRFWNTDVLKNMEEIVETVFAALEGELEEDPPPDQLR